MNVFSFELTTVISTILYTFVFGIFFGFMLGLIRYMMIHVFTKKT